MPRAPITVLLLFLCFMARPAAGQPTVSLRAIALSDHVDQSLAAENVPVAAGSGLGWALGPAWSGREGSSPGGSGSDGSGGGLCLEFHELPRANASGEVAILGTLTREGPVSPPERMVYAYSVWRGSSEGLELVAWTEAQGNDRLAEPGIDHLGGVTLWARESERASYRRYTSTGVFEVLAAEGAPAPGTGLVFDRLTPTHAHSAMGPMAFEATLRGESPGGGAQPTSGVWRHDGRELALVAAVWSQAPGLGAGVTYAGFNQVAISPGGLVAFSASLAGADSPMEGDHAVFAMDQSLRVVPVVRAGDVVEVRPGAFRRVRAARLLGQERGSPSEAFTADSRLIVTLAFTDTSTGIFEATVGSRADVDGDGSLTLYDLIAFQTRLAERDPRAELDADGAFTVMDFFVYMTEFKAQSGALPASL